MRILRQRRRHFGRRRFVREGGGEKGEEDEGGQTKHLRSIGHAGTLTKRRGREWAFTWFTLP